MATPNATPAQVGAPLALTLLLDGEWDAAAAAVEHITPAELVAVSRASAALDKIAARRRAQVAAASRLSPMSTG